MPVDYSSSSNPSDLNYQGNLLEINEDAVASTAEDATLRLLAGDGSNLQKWQMLLDSSDKSLRFQYAEDSASFADRVYIESSGQVTIHNPTEAQSNEVLIMRGADRATPQDDDQIIMGWEGKNSSGSWIRFAELRAEMRDVTAGTENGFYVFRALNSAASMINYMQVGTDETGAGQISMNNSLQDVDILLKTDLGMNAIRVDANGNGGRGILHIMQASTSGNTHDGWAVLENDSVQTTDATPTVIQSITINNNKLFAIDEITVAAKNSDTSKVGIARFSASDFYRQDGQSASKIEPDQGSLKLVGLNTATVEINLNVNTAEIVATGEAATTLEWHVIAKYFRV